MLLPSNFSTATLDIDTVEELLSWCFEVILAGYGPGEYRPTTASAVAFENYYIDGLDGNLRDRKEITVTLKYKENINGLSLKEWKKIDEFTSNAIPAAFLVAA